MQKIPDKKERIRLREMKNGEPVPEEEDTILIPIDEFEDVMEPEEEDMTYDEDDFYDAEDEDEFEDMTDEEIEIAVAELWGITDIRNWFKKAGKESVKGLKKIGKIISDVPRSNDLVLQTAYFYDDEPEEGEDEEEDATTKTESSIGVNTQFGGRSANVDEIPGSRFQQYILCFWLDFTVQTTHHPAHTEITFRICHQNTVRFQFMFDAIQGC